MRMHTASNRLTACLTRSSQLASLKKRWDNYDNIISFLKLCFWFPEFVCVVGEKWTWLNLCFTHALCLPLSPPPSPTLSLSLSPAEARKVWNDCMDGFFCVLDACQNWKAVSTYVHFMSDSFEIFGKGLFLYYYVHYCSCFHSIKIFCVTTLIS